MTASIEPRTDRGRHRAFWTNVCIFAVTLAAYFPALRAGFVWNDSDYVTSPALRAFRGIWRIWFDLGATQQYYPVLHSAFWIEHLIWGDAPLGYHLANIVLHATAACLLARVFGFLPGLLFGLHPVCAETVAWISEQKNTLSLVFYLLSALAFLRFNSSRRPGAYWAALGLFLLALLSKSVTATLPAALLVVLWWRKGRLTWKGDVRPLVPWLVLGAAGGLFTAWVERHYLGAAGAAFDLDWLQRSLLAGRAVWFYLAKVFWPSRLVFIYPHWSVNSSATWQYLFPLAALGLTGILWLTRRRCRGALAAWLFFVGSLFPTLGFLNVYAFVYSYVADHWQYLACLGVIVPVGTGLARAAKHPRRSVATAARTATLLLLGILGTLTWRQCRIYRDDETLYRSILAENPDAWMAHNNLGNILRDHGRPLEAEPHYRQVLQLNPGFAPAYVNLGNTLFQLGRLADAIDPFVQALRIDPANAEARTGLGGVLFQQGRKEEGLAQLEKAVLEEPDSAKARYNLAIALDQMGRIPEAADQFAAAMRLRPDSAQAHNNYGNALFQLGRRTEAKAQYEEALRIDPSYADARSNLRRLRSDP